MNRIALAAGLALTVAYGAASPAFAQYDQRRHERSEELQALHAACDQGDRRACVRFGMMLGENRERRAEWERSHPEWFWWNR